MLANALVMVRSYVEKNRGAPMSTSDATISEIAILTSSIAFSTFFSEAVAVGHADVPTCDDEVVKVPAGRRGTGMRHQTRRRHGLAGGTGRRSLNMATDTTCMIE